MEAVIRTVKMGHVFTQGTADSNQVWMDVQIKCGDEVIGQSGNMDGEGVVDPWAHFVNSFVIDREGNRIERHNAHDIFTSLYKNQIPPGAADVVHYRFRVPEGCDEPITISAELKYRKFDTTLMRFVHKDAAWINDLPITVLATDEVTLPLEGMESSVAIRPVEVPEWVRWNDYGISLLRKGGAGELKEAEEAFRQVEAAGKPDGPINLTRVYLKEGRVTEDAPAAISRAAALPAAREWHLLWFGGQVDRQNGRLDEAIAKYQQILEGGFAQAKGRGFDFTEDWRVLNEVGSTLYERARMARGEAGREERTAYLHEAAEMFEASLILDPEGMAAHYGLMQVLRDLGDVEGAAMHEALHDKYKPDDNAKDHAISQARQRYPAANRASEAVVIYELTPPAAGVVE
jgi:tetratricopeptide (TPR) repeat protein